ncbi:MAG: MtrB/PioB family outer membrane beta-barrel protein [Methylotenera sp.]|nr:MtrB/PioB family outer membrane beta-barrel protein [Methylotenera sp.]
MNVKVQVKLALIAMYGLAAMPLYAADDAQVGNTQAGITFSGELTPKLYGFDYTSGTYNDSTQYLERYNYQKGLGNNNRNGAYADLDVNIVGTDGQRNVFVLERQGFGAYNHRGTVKADSDTLGFAGYYSNFRSSSHGLNFLYTPGGGVGGGTDPAYNVPANANTGYLAQFNNDSPGHTKFNVDRTNYGASFALKPELFDANANAAFSYDGYQREGNRFATYILGNGDVNTPAIGAARVLQRWRGFDKPVDEKMNRYTLNLGGALGGFVLAYEGAVEKFDNKTRTFTVGDFATNINAAGTVNLDPGILTRSIHFIPDTTLYSNNFRVAKTFGTTAVAAGYGLSILDVDSFSQEQRDSNYNKGKVTTNSAYLNVSSNTLSAVRLEGFVKYNNRDNDSTFPAPGLLDPTDGEMLAVRVDELTTLSYGLAGTFRPSVWKSSVTVGWKAEDKDRDLTWSERIPSGGGNVGSVQPWESLYEEKTKTDELYVKWIARPMSGMVLRVTPSYTKASQTGLVSEPEKAFSLKNKLSYTADSGTMVSGYYNYRNAQNNDLAFTNSLANNVPTAISTGQDNDRTQQSAGVSLNRPFGEWINTSASLSWLQDDFSTYFLRSNRRRYLNLNENLLFENAGRSNYEIDTYVFTLAGDWQASDALRWSSSYTFTKSKGNTASGYVYDQLTENNDIDGNIDSSVHSVSVGVDYAVNKMMKLKGSYDYEYYQDKSFNALSGGYQAVMVGAALKF